jgi:hypothetical protein
MLIRIFLILAIIAGLGAGGVAYYEFSTQIPALTQQRDTEKTDKETALTQLANTNRVLVKTRADLAQTQQDLADTKADRDKALARADAQEKRANDLNDKLTKANSDLQDAQNSLAEYKASGLSAEEVVKLDKNYKDALAKVAVVEAEKNVLSRTLVATKARLAKYEDPDSPYVKLPAALKGNVVVVDPKWDFVVLNFGGDQGAVQDGELLVSRDGKLVAKVIIRSVEKDRCIANIVPGWKLGEVIEGDVVTPAHPATS